jgi:hypothetical protein
MDSDTDFESILIDPYRDDPVWEDVDAGAVDVKGIVTHLFWIRF